jgi:hypothetical protein
MLFAVGVRRLALVSGQKYRLHRFCWNVPFHGFWRADAMTDSYDRGQETFRTLWETSSEIALTIADIED